MLQREADKEVTNAWETAAYTPRQWPDPSRGGGARQSLGHEDVSSTCSKARTWALSNPHGDVSCAVLVAWLFNEVLCKPSKRER